MGDNSDEHLSMVIVPPWMTLSRNHMEKEKCNRAAQQSINNQVELTVQEHDPTVVENPIISK